jgi:serine/threonine protein kinase/Tol biopolymer transport system component
MASRPDDWSRVKDIFAHARAMPANARAAYVVEACSGDESLRQDVESLLAADKRAEGFLETNPRLLDGEPTESLEGRSIGAYQIGSLIGAGGMGEVYEGRDTILNRQVAIKVLLPIVAHDSESLTRFRREAQLLASLNHPHIAQVYGFEHTDDVWGLVMELVPGPTLAQRIGGRAAVDPITPTDGARKDAPLPIAEALGIAAQIASALEAAHEQGIIHRDLKPSNIKVRDDGTVKVLDFGLATALDSRMPREAGATRSSPGSGDATETGAIFGTPVYMSPEQARGQAVDRRADLWAFGCILYEMLTGRRAFEGDGATDVLEAVENAEPEWTRLPEKTPPAIRTLLRRCLEKSRARRLDSATAVRLEIDDALATVSSRVVAPSERPPDFPAVHQLTGDVPKQRTLAMLAVVIAVTLVTAGGFWQLWQRDYFWRNPLAGATVDRLTDFAGEETDAAISPDGKFLTFLSDRDGRFDAWISQIGTGEFTNITNGRFQMLNNPNARMVGFSGDGAQLWFEQEVSARPFVWTSWIRPLLGGTPRRFVEGGLEPTWSPDGSRVIYHTNDLGDPLFVANRDGSNPRKIFVGPPGVHGHYPSWSPNGRFVYLVMGNISTDELDIWRIALAAGGTGVAPERITSHNARIANPTWLDDRTLIYSATAEDGSGDWLYAVDVEHRIPHRVSSGISEQYMSVAVSNTQPRRVVTTIAVPTAQLWQVPIAGSVQSEHAATRLPVSTTRSLSPRFAPTYLVFLSSNGGADGLWKLEQGETTEIWRGADGGVVTPPAISRDGSQICFSFRRGGRAGLYVMNANGTNVRTLAPGLEVRGAATWSPDGKWVAVAGNRGDGTRVFKVPLDGGPPIQLANTLSVNPVWSPDGRLILYSEQQRAGQFEVKGMTPDQTPVPIVALQIVGFSTATRYRFVPAGDALIVLEGVLGASQNFFKVDLAAGKRHQLTDLDGTYVIRNFDVSPDGTRIVFDRWRQHADIAMMTLAR